MTGPTASVSRLTKSDAEAIHRVHNRWIENELHNDSAATLQLCVTDVVWMPPNAPALIGTAAIEKWVSRAQVRIRSIQITNLKIDGDGSVAYLTANYSTSYQNEPDGPTCVTEGAHLWILRKLTNDEWKVAVIMWSVFELEP